MGESQFTRSSSKGRESAKPIGDPGVGQPAGRLDVGRFGRSVYSESAGITVAGFSWVDSGRSASRLDVAGGYLLTSRMPTGPYETGKVLPRFGRASGFPGLDNWPGVYVRLLSSGLVSDELANCPDPASWAGGLGESLVAGHEVAFQCLGQSDVTGVICRDVGSQLEGSGYEGEGGVRGEREIEEVLHGGPAAIGADSSPKPLFP